MSDSAAIYHNKYRVMVGIRSLCCCDAFPSRRPPFATFPPLCCCLFCFDPDVLPLADRRKAAASAVSATPVMLDTYWEGKAPPSQVLGPALERAPSGALGIVSLVAFAVGTYCIHETNILHTVTPDTIQPLYVAGSVLVPISWGLHVASWIQKQNGK